jgi:hypothetical protein
VSVQNSTIFAMSLLVDYASSSEDEEASVPAPSAPARARAPITKPAKSPTSSSTDAAASTAPQKLKKKVAKKKKKTKTTLYLPPEIQRLLESGTLSDDSDDENELLAKHKKARKAASKRPRPTEDADSVLSFLPPPKHELPVSKVETVVPEQEKSQTQEDAIAATTTGSETQTGQPVDEQAANAAAWQQYYQQQHYQAADGFYVAQGEDDVPGGSSKRRRTRERDVERALQQGRFETVAEQITDVQGPSPFGWQPPVDPMRAAGGSSEQEVKVKASFWNAQAGAKVSSMKPSRLQRAKHQLNQLAFDAKARDFELLDKRSASLKTKRETYAKYGW